MEPQASYEVVGMLGARAWPPPPGVEAPGACAPAPDQGPASPEALVSSPGAGEGPGFQDGMDGGERDEPVVKMRSRAAAQGHGHVGGLLAGKLGSNKFVAEYAIDSRAKCRDAKCATFIAQGDLRIGKIPPSLNSVHGRTHWYHLPCIFRSFTRACRGTKTISSVDDVANFAFLKPEDQYRIQVAVQLSQGSRYCPPPRLVWCASPLPAPMPGGRWRSDVGSSGAFSRPLSDLQS